MKYTLLYISITLLLFLLFGHIDTPMSILHIVLSAANYGLCVIPGWFIVTGALGAIFATRSKRQGRPYIHGVGDGLVVSPPFLVLCEIVILYLLQYALWYFPTFTVWQMITIAFVRVGVMVLIQLGD